MLCRHNKQTCWNTVIINTHKIMRNILCVQIHEIYVLRIDQSDFRYFCANDNECYRKTLYDSSELYDAVYYYRLRL